MDPALIHIDGAARGNPGPAAIGVVIADHAGRTLLEHGARIGHATNNVAEYRALIRALELAQEEGIHAARVCSDSELLVRQMNGIYRVKSTTLLPLHQHARKLCLTFSALEIAHVPRRQNRRADQLANMALDAPEPTA